MTRKSLLAILVALALSLSFISTTVGAASKPTSGKSGAKSSGGGTKSSSPKTVHVKPYTKKDGTHVDGYDRKPPSQKKAKEKTEQPKKTKPAAEKASSTAVSGVARDENGRIARSEAAKLAFEKQTGYPHGRAGYIVDHIIPLACGGADAASNMQWQTIADAVAKDKVERAGCH